MAQVNVMVNGHAYTVACDAGEEHHVRELGQFVDQRVRELSGSVGQVGESRLLLMASLLVVDELWEARAKLDASSKELADLRSAYAQAAEMQQIYENRAADALEGASSRIETIAARLARA